MLSDEELRTGLENIEKDVCTITLNCSFTVMLLGSMPSVVIYTHLFLATSASTDAAGGYVQNA